MPKKVPLPRLSPKNIFTLIGLIALCVIIFFNRSILKESWHLLGQLNWYFIIAVVIVQLLSYLLNALYYHSILSVFEYSGISVQRLFEGALATNYVNYMVPSVGAAGAGFLSQVLSPEVKRGESVLSQLMRSVLDALALLLLMPIGLILLFVTHRQKSSVVKESVISTAVVFIASLLILLLVSQERRLRSVIGKIIRSTKHIYPGFNGERAIRNFLNSFYRGFYAMLNKKKRMLAPFGWSVLYVCIELFTLYLVFLAFREAVNPGIVIIGYLIANIVSIFGGLIFSVGAYELGMTGTFIALGINPGLAVSITVVYRALNLIISMPPGFIYYRKYLP